MEKIVSKLVEYGQDFRYENYGSDGEKVFVDFGLEVNNQYGTIHVDFEGNTEMWPEEPESWDKAVKKVESILIEETT